MNDDDQPATVQWAIEALGFEPISVTTAALRMPGRSPDRLYITARDDGQTVFWAYYVVNRNRGSQLELGPFNPTRGDVKRWARMDN